MARNRNNPKGKRSKGPISQPLPSCHGASQQVQRPVAPWLDGPNQNASSASPSRAGRRGHTLADEVRNTAQRPRGLFGQDSKLRRQPVKFVSAGFMDPLKDLEKDLEAQHKEANQIPQEQQVVTKLAVSETTSVSSSVEKDPVDQIPIHSKDVEPVETTMTPKDARGPSPSQLFTVDTEGDKGLCAKKQPAVVIPDDHNEGPDTDSSEDVILFKGRGAARGKAATNLAGFNTPKKSLDSMKLNQLDVEIKVVEKTIQLEEPSNSGPSQLDKVRPEENKLQSKSQKRRRNTQSEEEAAIIADYIANMDNEGEEEGHPGLGSHAFHMLRDLGGTDSDAVPEVGSEDDASEDKSSGDEDSVGIHRKAELADERMARILANQEELGLDADDIMLYDGADDEGDDGEGGWQIAPKLSPRRKKKGASFKAKIIQKKGQYPSATQLANAIDGELDLMDWNRPALNNFSTKKRKSSPPEVSDSELEEAMNLAWQRDRLTKAEKKKQREALRAQGLLGKNVDPDDLRIKYSAGMRTDDLTYELEQFLLGDKEQLILPPLEKAARRLIHMACQRLGIKTQSAGKGNSRYPILYRTKATIQYDDQAVRSATRRFLNQSYYARADADAEAIKEHKSRSRKETTTMDRGRNAISYREGEVVGQHAAELGTGNKGRLLLEKMGWSKGMTLGTGENKGIMVPVMHVVKKTKAGLGDT
ncbi:uncharacterized protein BCR38DRAFT_425911 [Pseudomassariella vexata]|uniref:Protein SQS1 n=1 Tax=Pseudomassariella vexata TaxID=1141098 RepID=A0A1Y2E672_9PEZI|nr:uncharacterized protein BCR38DRAFT_425911 [Pseudomassariella vexata]ORY67051.1 hypothetical protein BCR38DRAFT_425911 [Pseudomassariella vexata]